MSNEEPAGYYPETGIWGEAHARIEARIDRRPPHRRDHYVRREWNWHVSAGRPSSDGDSTRHGGRSSMNRRKFLLGSAATLTGSGLLVGAQGYSRVESQRMVRIQVEGDEDAYLRLLFPNGFEITRECGGKAQLLVIGNQTKERLDDIEVNFQGDIDEVVSSEVEFCGPGEGCYSDGCEEREIADNSVTVPSLGTGDMVALCVTIDCPKGTAEEESIGLSIDAKGSDTRIVAHREQPEVDITCTCPSEETAYAYGGDKDQSAQDPACYYDNSTTSDNPFGYLFETCGSDEGGDSGSYCQGQWGWFITEEQIKNSGPLPLYAGAGGYDLGSATFVGKVYANFENTSTDDPKKLFVNYSFEDQAGNKSIKVEDTKFTIVEHPCDILNNSGNGVAPGNWDPKYSDQGKDGQLINVEGMDNVVLAAHADVTLTENTS